ncbi:ABC transporter ATP-binding protein [Clostridiaceae bacterium M8S5]|nr:ABC transporter ATP-binding protein [Clostridiaceae bacterium M8S5]
MNIKSKKYKPIDYIAILWKLKPLITSSIIILRILIALIPSFLVLATTYFINTAIGIFNGEQMLSIHIPLIAIMVLVGFSWLSNMVLEFVKLKLILKTNEAVSYAIIKKRACLSYKHIENNDTWDLISRVGECPSKQIIDGFDNILNILEYIVKIGSIIFIISVQVWWVSIFILVIAIPLFKLSFKCGQADYEAYKDAKKYKRKADYLTDVISSRNYVEERSLFGFTKELNKKWFNEYEIARKIEYKVDKNNFIKMQTASSITVVLSVLIALVLLSPVKNGLLTAGMYMSLVTASFKLVQQMSWQLSYTMQKYSRNKVYMQDLTEFSYLDEEVGTDELADISIRDMNFEYIEFRDVYFSYPNTDKRILNGLSMKLEKDRLYAFVGENGAGKTTIVKLLTGLYTNYTGTILINGKDIKEYTQQQLKALFSVVYQNYAKYWITIKDNVALGDCNTVYNYNNNKKVSEILQDIEMLDDIEKLPLGIETTLGKINQNGKYLSGGQWQRIAIARTLASDAPVYILDEPTAALDPISESNIYKLFGKVSRGKSSILITHRLGAARIADEILVVDNGVIAEKGTHEELVNKKGIYNNMFIAQRSWYYEKGK